MRRRDDEVRLPAEVVELLNTKGIPKTAVAIRRNEGADMPLTTRGLRAATDRLNAESDLIDANYRLEAKRGDMVTVEDLRARVTDLESQNRDLRDEATQLRAEIQRLTAKDAMAINAGGSQR